MKSLRIPPHIVAIDCHVHPATAEAKASGGAFVGAARRHFKSSAPEIVTFAETAEMYRRHDMMCVLLGRDARTNTGDPPIPNDSIATAVRDHPDVFLGFGAVDPHRTEWAVEEIHRIAEIGLRGIKFQQIVQGFRPDRECFFPIYEAIQKLGLVALFHMGTTGIGAGMPGGMGLKLRYAQPIYIDDVAATFPEMRIIAAHPGWPWTEELLAIAVHKANVFIDMSGWAPKYFPPQFVHYARTLLQDKMLFGTDWPLLTVERWQEEFDRYDFPEAVRSKIMLANSLRVLELTQ